MKSVLGKFKEYRDLSHLDLEQLNEESALPAAKDNFHLDEDSLGLGKEPESFLSNLSMRTLKP